MTKLLIAEDDPAISMLEQDYLELEGFEVTVVGNGQLAVTEALTGQYALILLDLMLPSSTRTTTPERTPRPTRSCVPFTT